jgi:hypothetical protein
MVTFTVTIKEDESGAGTGWMASWEGEAESNKAKAMAGITAKGLETIHEIIRKLGGNAIISGDDLPVKPKDDMSMDEFIKLAKEHKSAKDRLN